MSDAPAHVADPASALGPDGFVHVRGIPIRAAAWSTALVFVSVAVRVVLLPVVGVIADRSGRPT